MDPSIEMMLDLCEHITKGPPRHQSHYCGSTFNVVYRKLKGVAAMWQTGVNLTYENN
jgi:hypothetical protein